MGLFKKRATDPAEMERLRAEIAAMGSRLDAADTHKAELGNQVNDLASKLAETPPPDDRPSIEPADLDAVRTQVERIVTRLETPLTPPPDQPPPIPVDRADLDELRDRLEQIAGRIDEVDTRITAISTELANQINELSGDLDGTTPGAPVADDIADELRDAQTRLANEQARYQIAFRQDLAELADRLKRS